MDCEVKIETIEGDRVENATSLKIAETASLR